VNLPINGEQMNIIEVPIEKIANWKLNPRSIDEDI